MRDGKWLPLTASLVQEQRKKLEAIVAPIALRSASKVLPLTAEVARAQLAKLNALQK